MSSPLDERREALKQAILHASDAATRSLEQSKANCPMGLMGVIGSLAYDLFLQLEPQYREHAGRDLAAVLDVSIQRACQMADQKRGAAS